MATQLRIPRSPLRGGNSPSFIHAANVIQSTVPQSTADILSSIPTLLHKGQPITVSTTTTTASPYTPTFDLSQLTPLDNREMMLSNMPHHFPPLPASISHTSQQHVYYSPTHNNKITSPPTSTSFGSRESTEFQGSLFTPSEYSGVTCAQHVPSGGRKIILSDSDEQKPSFPAAEYCAEIFQHPPHSGSSCNPRDTYTIQKKESDYNPAIYHNDAPLHRNTVVSLPQFSPQLQQNGQEAILYPRDVFDRHVGDHHKIHFKRVHPHVDWQVSRLPPPVYRTAPQTATRYDPNNRQDLVDLCDIQSQQNMFSPGNSQATIITTTTTVTSQMQQPVHDSNTTTWETLSPPGSGLTFSTISPRAVVNQHDSMMSHKGLYQHTRSRTDNGRPVSPVSWNGHYDNARNAQVPLQGRQLSNSSSQLASASPLTRNNSFGSNILTESTSEMELKYNQPKSLNRNVLLPHQTISLPSPFKGSTQHTGTSSCLSDEVSMYLPQCPTSQPETRASVGRPPVLHPVLPPHHHALFSPQQPHHTDYRRVPQHNWYATSGKYHFDSNSPIGDSTNRPSSYSSAPTCPSCTNCNGANPLGQTIGLVQSIINRPTYAHPSPLRPMPHKLQHSSSTIDDCGVRIVHPFREVIVGVVTSTGLLPFDSNLTQRTCRIFLGNKNEAVVRYSEAAHVLCV